MKANADTNRIVSIYRTRTDDCNRMWFVDTGTLEINGLANFIQPPSIWIIDLRNDKVLRRFELPDSIGTNPMGLKSITVDVDRLRCEDAFAYIPNSINNHIIVYSFKDNGTWIFNDQTLKNNDNISKLLIDNNELKLIGGVYSIALGPRNTRERNRKIYYHPLTSFFEYSTESKILKNRTLSLRAQNDLDFKYVGNRGDGTQSGMHEYDPRTKVLFFTELQKNSIRCWNTGRPLIPTNVDSVAQNDYTTLIYPSDVKIDRAGNLWFFSNQQPLFENKLPLDRNNINFYVFKKTTRSLIEGTVCQSGATINDNIKNDEENDDVWNPDIEEKTVERESIPT